MVPARRRQAGPEVWPPLKLLGRGRAELLLGLWVGGWYASDSNALRASIVGFGNFEPVVTQIDVCACDGD